MSISGLKEASHYSKTRAHRCVCGLCPRGCEINPGQKGYCLTRENIDGTLYAVTYGKALEMSQEVIETEAVYLRDPGTAILSVGNIGCNMGCDFCQNWTTSQLKYINPHDIITLTAEGVVKEALRRNIPIISWTYNDPVVWHEFVVETAGLAKKMGVRNLYKSAFYINEAPVKDLLEVIDTFSISLKSLDDEFYRNYCKTSLPPVLERIKQVYKAEKYLELSNLVVTGRNDTLDQVEQIARWVLEELDEQIPVHFVAFHPAYLYSETARTSEGFLKQARDRALEMGLQHVNIGNVFNSDLSPTYCKNCHEVLFRRHGLHTEICHLHVSDQQYECSICGKKTPLNKDVGDYSYQSIDFYQPKTKNMKNMKYVWGDEKVAIHVRGIHHAQSIKNVFFQHRMANGQLSPFMKITFYPNEPWRSLIQRYSETDLEIIFYYDQEIDLYILELLDRAHYPSIHPQVREVDVQTGETTRLEKPG